MLVKNIIYQERTSWIKNSNGTIEEYLRQRFPERKLPDRGFFLIVYRKYGNVFQNTRSKQFIRGETIIERIIQEIYEKTWC